MQKLTTTLLILIFTLYYGVVYADQQMEVGNYVEFIPKKHGYIPIVADINNMPDDETLKNLLDKTRKEHGVEQIQTFLFDKNDDKNVVGYAHYRINFFYSKLEKPVPYDSIFPYFGYWITPQQLWDEYKNNELVASETYDKKLLILTFKTDGVSLDFNNQPYIECPLKEPLSSIQVQLKKNDEFVRELKKGQTVGVQASVKNFMMETVYLKGKIVQILQDK